LLDLFRCNWKMSMANCHFPNHLCRMCNIVLLIIENIVCYILHFEENHQCKDYFCGRHAFSFVIWNSKTQIIFNGLTLWCHVMMVIFKIGPFCRRKESIFWVRSSHLLVAPYLYFIVNEQLSYSSGHRIIFYFIVPLITLVCNRVIAWRII
jgi:hypothetical protein